MSPIPALRECEGDIDTLRECSTELHSPLESSLLALRGVVGHDLSAGLAMLEQLELELSLVSSSEGFI